MLPEEDLVRLRHMLDAARAGIEFARNRTRQELDSDLQFGAATLERILRPDSAD